MNRIEIDIIKVLGDEDKFYYGRELLLYEKLNNAIGYNTLSYNFNIGIAKCIDMSLRKYINLRIFNRKGLLNKKYKLKSRGLR